MPVLEIDPYFVEENPMMLFTQYVINGIIVGVVYALMAVSYSLIFSTTRIFHLAHAAVFCMGGMITWFLMEQGISLWVAMGVTLVLAASAGALIEVSIYRPLRRRGAPYLLIMIASLGVLISIQSILALVFSPNIRFLSVEFKPILLGELVIPGWQAYSLLLGAVAIGLLGYILYRTRVGDEMRALACNEIMSKIVGIDIQKTYLFSIIIGSVLAALSGIILAVDNGANPYAGLVQLLTSLAITILAGVGNNQRIVVISLLFGVLQNISLMIVPSEWVLSVCYAIMVVLILMRANPQRQALERMGGAM
jgi:branched-chain amino acid transport system permease protein